MEDQSISILSNLAKSFVSIQPLIGGLAYLFGIAFVMVSIGKLRIIADSRAMGGGGGQRMFVPAAYFLSGIALLYLPSTLQVISSSTFGTDSILSYPQKNGYDFYTAILIILQTAGLIWFVRGCILLAHASEPGVQHGMKGILFIIAGIFAVNFENTASAFSSLVIYLMKPDAPN